MYLIWMHIKPKSSEFTLASPNIIVCLSCFVLYISIWSKQHMMTSWKGNAFRITGPLWRESNGHRIYLGPVMRGFGVSYYVSLNKLFDKQSICRWFETPWRSRECTVATTHFKRRVISEITFEFGVRYWWFFLLLSGHRVAAHCCIYKDGCFISIT